MAFDWSPYLNSQGKLNPYDSSMFYSWTPVWSNPNVLLENPYTPADYTERSALKDAPAGLTARDLVSRIIQDNPQGAAATLLGDLGNAGYLQKLAGWDEIAPQVGDWVAKGQASLDTGDFGPEGLLKANYIHLGNAVDDITHGKLPIGNSTTIFGAPSDETNQEISSRGADPGPNTLLHNTAALAALAGVGSFLGGAGTTEGVSAAGGASSGGGAAAGEAAGLTGFESLGSSAIPGGAGGAAGGAGAAASSAALPAVTGGAAAADVFGGMDNAAVAGADYSGAAEAGLGAGSITGAGAAGTAAASAAGGGSSGGGSSGGGSASGGGGTGGGSWLTDDDTWLQMLSRGIPGLLGALGSASQAEDMEDLAHQYQQMGAPYRSKLSELYGNPQAFLNSPEVRVPIQQGTDMLARSLSVKGNPAGSGNALQELQNYASNQLFGRLGQEKDRLAGFGGLTQYNQAAPQAAQNVIGAQGNIYSNLGGAAADIFNPQRRYTLQDLLRMN